MWRCAKNICCFDGSYHISKLVIARDVPSVCVVQVEEEFAAPSEKCLVIGCEITKNDHSAILCVFSDAHVKALSVISAGVALQHGRNVQFLFCWSNETPTARATVPCVANLYEQSIVFFGAKITICYERSRWWTGQLRNSLLCMVVQERILLWSSVL